MIERWFATNRTLRMQQHETRDEIQGRYLPMLLKDAQGHSHQSDIVLELLSQINHIWVQGRTGMGKSSLVMHLGDRFFAAPDETSLRQAYGRYGFLPLVLRLSNYRTIPYDPNDSQAWLVKVAHAAFQDQGMNVEDLTLFKGLLRYGKFALVLDGANEVVNSDAFIHSFADKNRDIPILVTSQARPKDDVFTVLRLPKTITSSMQDLMHLYLGAEQGELLFEAVVNCPELHETIESGYDMRLLIELFQEANNIQDIPGNRLELYEAAISRLQRADGRPLPKTELFKLAWDMWKSSKRTVTSNDVSPETFSILSDDQNRMFRTLQGEEYEFRHDQMRAYLAACWASKEAVSPVRLFETDSSIWSLGNTEQIPVWHFFAGMVDTQVASEVWQWATADPARVLLQNQLQLRLQREGRMPHIE